MEKALHQKPWISAVETASPIEICTGNDVTESPIEISYKMNYESRGIALIFNNWKFKELKNRPDAREDYKVLEDALIHLGFAKENIKGYDNCTKEEMKEKVKSVSSENHSEHDCLLIVIMTYGQNGLLYTTDDSWITMNEICEPFLPMNCPSLKDKPKLFFIQASEAEGMNLKTTGSMPMAVPNTFIYFSRVPGSLFIRSLSSVFKERGQMLDLVSMLTLIDQKVMKEYESGPSKPSIDDVMPYYSGPLRKLYFYPKKLNATARYDRRNEPFVPEFTYDMKYQKRGHACICYGSSSSSSPKTQEDYKELVNMFHLLGFEKKDISLHQYSDREGLKIEIAKVANLDHSDCDCLVVVIFVPGDLKLLFAEEAVDEGRSAHDAWEGPPAHDVWESLTARNAPTLAEKPKLFFIHQAVPSAKDVVDAIPQYTYRTPLYSDFFFAFSYDFYYNDKDLPYVPIPSDIIEQFGNSMDFLTMFTMANGILLNHHMVKKPVPYLSMLRRNIFFQPKTSVDLLPDAPASERLIMTVANENIVEYRMDNGHRGTALIINHSEFEEFLHLPKRKGSYLDCDKLSNMIKNQLGFSDVRMSMSMSPKGKVISDEIQKAASEDYRNRDCVLVAVMTHGDFGMLYSRDSKYPMKDLWEPFLNNDTLQGKPKIFIIQACQGNERDEGHVMNQVPKQNESPRKKTFKESDPKLSDFIIVPHPDVVVALSTVPGFIAWLNEEKGSWFIQSLCEIFEMYSEHLDFITMLTLVNQKVAFQYESNVPLSPNTIDMDRKKQMPCHLSSLTRRLNFKCQ